MKRFILRSAKNPPTDYPKRIRASTLGKWYYCAEQTRHRIMGLVPPDKETNEFMETGTILHKILEESMGRRFPFEIDFMTELQKLQDPELGFKRRIWNSTLYHNLTGHPDDIQITPDRIVSLVEHKTVKNPSEWYIKRYKLCMARFQTQIYAWILEPIVQKLGGVINRYHAVIFWNMRTFDLIKTFTIPYYPVQTKEDILRCLRAFKNPKEIIRPKAWKCKYCPKANKEKCQFWKEEKEKNASK